jgi:predicted permease
MKSSKPFSDRIYQKLLRILPFDFRMDFEEEMKDVFRDQRRDVKKQQGVRGLLRMWWSTVLDLFRLAPREHFQVLTMDVKFATRMMRKSPGFVIAAVLILGLGIGANTAIFSIVNSVLLKPLPYIYGDKLVILRQPEEKLGTDDALFSVQEIDEYRKQTQTLSNVVEYHNMTFTLLGKGTAHRIRAGVVSHDFFEVFGVRPLLGRAFVSADQHAGSDAVLILSYEFWQQVEGGDPQIVGRKYQMNDRVHTVIGVLPPIPQYPDENDAYMPTTSCPIRSNPEIMSPRTARMMSVFGRLKDGYTVEQSQTEIAQIAKQFHQHYPDAYPTTAGHATEVSLLQSDLIKKAKHLLYLLWGAAGFVLLIACANVGNLVMARMAGRQQELLVRTAVGAGSGRLLRQLLTESFFLAFLASIFGLLFAIGSIELMKEFAGQLTSRAREIKIDPTVLLFTMACASLTTIFFGSVAAIYSRQDISSGLKEGGRTGTEGGSNLLRKMLIAVQVAFSCVLLIGAGLMVRSFIRIVSVDPGFQPDKVLAVRLNLNGEAFDTPEQLVALAKRIQEKITTMPGVQSVAVSSSFPLDEENFLGGRPVRFRVEGDPRSESDSPPVSTVRSASVDYFKTLGIRLIAGRTFLESDDADAPAAVLMNQNLAMKRWGRENPVGKRITLDNGQNWMTVVGIVGDVKEFGLNLETPYQLYRPFAQTGFLGSVLVRTSLEGDVMSEPIRRALRDIEPRMAIVRIQTMEQVRAKSVASPRTLMHLFSLFGILAFIISIAGIGSMLSLWVNQRTRETGIRMALGATPKHILASVMKQGILLAVAGLLLGLAGALTLTQMLSVLLFQIRADDPPTYVLATLLLLLAAVIACYSPARRASRVDPQIALHTD